MQRILPVAIVLLLLQIGLIAVTNTQRSSFAPYTPNVNLVNFQAKDVDSVIITDAKDHGITLNKENGSWIIADSSKVPAAKAKVEALLSTLAESKRGLAVATTADAASRFNVDKKDFNLHLLLKKGTEVLGDIYFGKSAGYKQLYVRTADSDDIVSISLSSNDVSAQRRDWIDTGIFHLDTAAIKEINIQQNSINKVIDLHRGADKKWFADTLLAKSAQSTEAAALVDKIASLNVFDLADTLKNVEEKKKEQLAFTVVQEKGSPLTYSVIPVDDKSYRIERSDRKSAFLVSKWIVDEITDSITKIEKPQQVEKQEQPVTSVVPGKVPAVPVPEK